MFVPLWLIIGNGVLLALLAYLAVRSGGESDDMIERQRRAAPPPAQPPAPMGTGSPKRTDVDALMQRPDIAEHLANRRHIAAIRLVREATGLGLKDAKQIVDLYRR